jgi:WD domain, G-beta repeat
MSMNYSLLSWPLCVIFFLWLWTAAAFSRSQRRNALSCGARIYQVCRLGRGDTLSYQCFDSQLRIDRGKLGVTSASLLPSGFMHNCSRPSDGTRWVMLGTKYGDLVILPFEYNSTWQLSQQYSVSWLSSVSLPLPIYSLITTINESGREGHLLAGGADRYISIWKRLRQTAKFAASTNMCDWEMVQRLGPHTGWVKSILHVPLSPRHDASSNRKDALPRHRLYSIGCNRIECWACNEYGNWTHKKTVAISSSPTFKSIGGSEASVCTLSSDLLCLELCKITSSTYMDDVLFAAGGVDGRIHFFLDFETATAQRLENIATVVGHQGRVNTLSFDKHSQLLFSGSHDGNIHCWQLSFYGDTPKGPTESLSRKLDVFLVASHGFCNDTRVTALSCSTGISSSGDVVNRSVDVLVGTQNGKIHLLSLVLSAEKLKSRRHNFVDCDTLCIGNESDILAGATGHYPIMHTFCRLIDDDLHPPTRAITLSFVVGHSQGFGLVTLTHDV